MFEVQKSENKTCLEETSLNIRTHASPQVGQDQLSVGVGTLCWLTAPVSNVPWKPLANWYKGIKVDNKDQFGIRSKR